MLVPLNITASQRTDPANGVDLLVECHARIRRYLGMAERLANVDHAPDAEVVDAVSALLRYFEQAFPLHVVDEDLSLLPRLKQLELPVHVSVAIQLLEWEHEEIDPLIEGLCLLWKDVQATPRMLVELQPHMLDLLDTIRPKLLGHLELEEEVVLPFAREALGEAGLRELAAQMRHRRER